MADRISKIICTAISFLIFGGLRVYASVYSGDFDASAGFTEGYICEDNIIEGNVSVFVSDEVFNDSVKFSYHIEDDVGNMLVYENERIPLAGLQLPAEIPVRIDLNEVLRDTEQAVVVFDIVDEENIYWFSGNTGLKCRFERIALGQKTEAANEPAQVVIKHDLPRVINDSEPVVNAEVFFGQTELYNDQVKLSYKIYDSDMELISGENERYELGFDGAKGTAQMQLSLSKIAETSGKDSLIIRFDLVDEKNIYWFGDSPAIDLQSETIEYKYDKGYEIKKQYMYILCHQYIQVAVNAAGIVFAVVLLGKLRKRLKSEQ